METVAQVVCYKELTDLNH